jgi:hypothetical protein
MVMVIMWTLWSVVLAAIAARVFLKHSLAELAAKK